MKNKTKPRMSRVHLEPDALRLIDRVCEVEGLTREEVLETLMHSLLSSEETEQ